MAAAFHIKDTKEHFHFIPEKFRNEVKIALALMLGLACLSLFLMLGISM